MVLHDMSIHRSTNQAENVHFGAALKDSYFYSILICLIERKKDLASQISLSTDKHR